MHIFTHSVFLHLISQSAGFRQNSDKAPKTGESTFEGLTLSFWTWNSANDDLDLSRAARVLSESNSDLIVTCQTEAVRDIVHDLEPLGWERVGGGQHSGSTGMDLNRVRLMNEQVLGIFVNRSSLSSRRAADENIVTAAIRAGVGNPLYHGLFKPMGDVTGFSKALRWASGWGAMHPMEVGRPNSSEVSMVTTSFVVNSDWKGKGGVGATLEMGQSLLQVACMHFDSYSAKKRGELTEAVIGEFAKARSYTGSLQDATQVVLGDFNYRLPSTGMEKNTLLDSLHLPSFRRSLASLDPLNQKSTSKAPLLERHGFLCNEPYALYPPTYRRAIDSNACLQLSDKHNARECYKAVFKEKRPGLLELGWLDRVCWRAAPGLDVSVLMDNGWEEDLGSDHMPVWWKLQLSKASV